MVECLTSENIFNNHLNNSDTSVNKDLHTSSKAVILSDE